MPQFVSAAITSWQLSPFVLIMLLMVFYIVLGTVLEGFSMIVLTLPIVLPVVLAAGFDKIWFGIFLILTIEMAQITRRSRFNLFVIQNMTGDSQILCRVEGDAVLPDHVRLRATDHARSRHRHDGRPTSCG